MLLRSARSDKTPHHALLAVRIQGEIQVQGTRESGRGGMVMCEYCESPNKTIVTHRLGVSAFVGAGRLFLRFFDAERNETIASMADIKYCPMCRRKFKEKHK